VIGDTGNFNNPDTTPQRELSEAAVRELAGVVAQMKRV